MKICIVGKYPPIEGGVSTSTFWIAYGLAERGHEVHVVTNADEVEDTYRMALAEDDMPWYQPVFPASSGAVHVHATTPFSRRALDHIPLSNPFVSKLAALATDVIRAHGCELILAYYFEPYVVGAWLASQWTGCPMLVKHAGSDLDRLCRSQELATTYREILRDVDAVVTRPALMERFLGMGVDPVRLEADPGFFVPARAFHPEVPPLDLRAAMRQAGYEEAALQRFDGRATIGIYGKIGETKGTFDLIAALRRLADEGLDFNLAALIGATQSKRLATALDDARLRDRTCILPFLPNWRVPSFLRACTAVCFLERDFPVAIHGPIIPREVLACGTCLVLSDEIASKQPYRDSLRHGENVVLVQDPKNHGELAAALRPLLGDAARAFAIGARGHDISKQIEDFPAFVDAWETLLVRSTSGGRHVPSADVPRAIDLINPALVTIVRECAPGVVSAVLDTDSSREPLQTAIRFCDLAAQHVTQTKVGDEPAKLIAALRYQKARLDAHCAVTRHRKPVFACADHLRRQPVTYENVASLCPVRSNALLLEDFEWNIVPFMSEPLENSVSLAALEPDRQAVLFCCSPNHYVRELRIDGATRELLACCDGTRLTRQLAEHMRAYFKADSVEQVTPALLAALDRLYQADVLIFGSVRSGPAWLGGSQGTSVEPISSVLMNMSMSTSTRSSLEA